MPEYSYRAVDRAGVEVSGNMTAPDEAALDAKLQQTGYWLIDAKPKAREEQQEQRRKRKVRRRDLIQFFAGMAQLMKAGVTVIDALEEMGREGGNEGFSWVINDMARNIHAGVSVHEAMALHPEVFERQVVDLVRAGEFSGNLIDTFEELRRYMEWVEQLMAQIKQASIYPIMVLLAVCGFVALLFTFVVPKFAALLLGLGIPLPLPTRAVIATGAFMSRWWWAVLLVVVAAVAGFRQARRRSAAFAMKVDHVKMTMPVFGELNRMIALSRLSHNLAVLLRAGVPLLEALELCRSLTGSPLIERGIAAAEAEIASGGNLSESLERHRIFPHLLLRMISVGEASGTLDDALDYVARYYDEEIPVRIKRVFSVVEPMIIVTLVGIVGFVALAMFLPMVGMMSGAIKH
ncbi:MAG: type II secretion system F family protein [Zetaproteobacteria bacterium]|nr:MAG: type II secretion system F family protein [Zetaproteobacteria bacterium]